MINTASEYMFQMATVTYHTLHGSTTVVLPEDVEYNGETFKAGEYEFVNDGRYWVDFDRSHPIEGPARAQIWSPAAHALIGELGVGTATASALQLGLAMAALFGGVGGTFLFIGGGLFWTTRPEPRPSRSYGPRARSPSPRGARASRNPRHDEEPVQNGRAPCSSREDSADAYLRMRIVTADEAVAGVSSGEQVFVHCVAATPSVSSRPWWRGPRSCAASRSSTSISRTGAAPRARDAESFHHGALFIGANARAAVNEGRADYVPVFLSDVPRLFRQGPPADGRRARERLAAGRHGFCSLGTSVDATLAACVAAKTVIAQ